MINVKHHGERGGDYLFYPNGRLLSLPRGVRKDLCIATPIHNETYQGFHDTNTGRFHVIGITISENDLFSQFQEEVLSRLQWMLELDGSGKWYAQRDQGDTRLQLWASLEPRPAYSPAPAPTRHGFVHSPYIEEEN